MLAARVKAAHRRLPTATTVSTAAEQERTLRSPTCWRVEDCDGSMVKEVEGLQEADNEKRIQSLARAVPQASTALTQGRGLEAATANMKVEQTQHCPPLRYSAPTFRLDNHC